MIVLGFDAWGSLGFREQIGKSKNLTGAPAGIQTPDPVIKSPP
jgi:hypothetical protein